MIGIPSSYCKRRANRKTAKTGVGEAWGVVEWDSVKMRFANNNEANQYLKRTLRKGFTISS